MRKKKKPAKKANFLFSNLGKVHGKKTFCHGVLNFGGAQAKKFYKWPSLASRGHLGKRKNPKTKFLRVLAGRSQIRPKGG